VTVGYKVLAVDGKSAASLSQNEIRDRWKTVGGTVVNFKSRFGGGEARNPHGVEDLV
jgi:hypothetical protein